jgi:hypothetical protein
VGQRFLATSALATGRSFLPRPLAPHPVPVNSEQAGRAERLRDHQLEGPERILRAREGLSARGNGASLSLTASCA